MRYPTDNFRITSSFGHRHRKNSVGKTYTDYHPGIDLGAIKAGVSGDPIHPVADNGKVMFKGYDQWRGNNIIIQHTSHTFRFCHLKEVFVNEGDIVNEDDVIAAMGNTGDSSGPHLHFEVHACLYDKMFETWSNGEPKHAVDPEKFFMQYLKPKHQLITDIELVLNEYK